MGTLKAISNRDGPIKLEDQLEQCEEAMGYRFQDRDILKRSLTHASVAKNRLASNERLEFLGDAILGAVISDILYDRNPDAEEGELTRIKSIIVSRATCASVTSELGLHEYLFLGKGLLTHEEIPMSIVAAVIESLIAGMYLDGGWKEAFEFIEKSFTPEIDRVMDQSEHENYKSLLQQITQKRLGETPVYRLLDEKGPDHCKCFEVTAVIASRKYPSAWGPTKKEAEQQAAKMAIDLINAESDDPEE